MALAQDRLGQSQLRAEEGQEAKAGQAGWNKRREHTLPNTGGVRAGCRQRGSAAVLLPRRSVPGARQLAALPTGKSQWGRAGCRRMTRGAQPCMPAAPGPAAPVTQRAAQTRALRTACGDTAAASAAALRTPRAAARALPLALLPAAGAGSAAGASKLLRCLRRGAGPQAWPLHLVFVSSLSRAPSSRSAWARLRLRLLSARAGRAGMPARQEGAAGMVPRRAATPKDPSSCERCGTAASG